MSDAPHPQWDVEQAVAHGACPRCTTPKAVVFHGDHPEAGAPCR